MYARMPRPTKLVMRKGGLEFGREGPATGAVAVVIHPSIARTKRRKRAILDGIGRFAVC
jgi:hypothetical protein